MSPSVEHVVVWPAAATADDVTPALLGLDDHLREIGCVPEHDDSLRQLNQRFWQDPTWDWNHDGRHTVVDLPSAEYTCNGATVSVQPFDLDYDFLVQGDEFLWEEDYSDHVIAWQKERWPSQEAARIRLAQDDSIMYWRVRVGVDDYWVVPR